MASARIRRLLKAVREHDLDSLIVSSLDNVRYLTGFTGSNALCIVGRTGVYFLTDSRYALQSKQEVQGCRRIVSSLGIAAIAGKGMLRGARRVGFEADHLPYAYYRQLKKELPGVDLRPAPPLVEDLAVVKDADEIRSIRRAVRISDEVFAEVAKWLRPGMRERDIAAEISYRQKRRGAEGDAFESIVVAGERGALPHARPADRRIRTGEFLTLDFGAVVQGYRSDVTRTLAVGRATRRMRETYDAVLRAQLAAINGAKGGMPAKDLDALARSALRTAGLARFFTHSLGHGIGLRIHERPRVSALSNERLLRGSVITIEPGVYIPGFGGVRIEDDVVIGEGSCEVLNKATKELTII